METGWIGSSPRKRDIEFPNGTSWRLADQIIEKSRFHKDEGDESEISHDDEDDEREISEATALFECIQIGGDTLGVPALIRIRMQIPRSGLDYIDPDADERAKEAEEQLGIETRQELDALQRLTQARCPYTPRLLSWKREVQGQQSWIPGGYIVYILIEKLPGQPPNTFWEKPLAERDEIRGAFTKALKSVREHRLDPGDCRKENLLWDEESRTCYLVDLEDFEELDDYDVFINDPDNGELQTMDYLMWGLVKAKTLPKSISRWKSSEDSDLDWNFAKFLSMKRDGSFSKIEWGEV